MMVPRLRSSRTVPYRRRLVPAALAVVGVAASLALTGCGVPQADAATRMHGPIAATADGGPGPTGPGDTSGDRTGGGGDTTGDRTAGVASRPGDGAQRGGGDAGGGPAAGNGPERHGRAGAKNGAAKDTAQPKQPNAACTLTVPPDPVSAAGLTTPYRLAATDRAQGACHEANAQQSAFVEATIVDPATGALSVYRPLVIDEGTRPAAPPVPLRLPAGAVVGVWFGFQGDTLTLRTPAGSGCVNGTPGSPFGQFGYCNAPAFFAAANAASQAGRLAVPKPGTANDERPCPTTRDFGVVDQDQSDNLVTVYRALPDGRTAQDGTVAGGTRLTNASDNGLLDTAIDPALGCRPFTAPDLTAGGTPGASLALNELQAAAGQAAPVATVPPNDPMVQVDGHAGPAKTALYRAGVDMAPDAAPSPAAYCTSLRQVAPERLALDRRQFEAAPSPDPAAAATLFGFLTQRLTTSWQNLGCTRIVGQGPPTVPGS